MDSDVKLISDLIHGLGLTLATGVVLIALIVTLGWQYLKTSVEKRAIAAIDRELDAHRQQLQLSADSVRLDFQRRLADFGLYNEQRHRCYRRLFRRALEAEGALGSQVGGFIATDFSNATKDQVAEILERAGTAGEVRDAILGVWEEDRSAADRLLDDALRRARELRAHQSFQRFKNELLVSDLYVSQTVRESLIRLNLVLASLSAHIMVPDDSGVRPFELKQQASMMTAELRIAMANDLSRGDYGVPVDRTLPRA